MLKIQTSLTQKYINASMRNTFLKHNTVKYKNNVLHTKKLSSTILKILDKNAMCVHKDHKNSGGPGHLVRVRGCPPKNTLPLTSYPDKFCGCRLNSIYVRKYMQVKSGALFSAFQGHSRSSKVTRRNRVL